MILKIKSTDYIVGLWMAQQVYLGKVFVYSIKGKKDDEWTKYVRYIYLNQSYNIYMSDNDYKNTFKYNGIKETDIIKICNEKINELSILFCHNKEKVLIGGGLTKYKEVALKNEWMLPIGEFSEDELKRLKGAKNS